MADLLGQLGYPADADAVGRRLARLIEDGDSNVAFVADAGGGAIGLITAYTRDVIHRDEPFCRIAAMVVDAEWRGRGIGRRLVEAVEQWARERGCAVSEVSSGVHRPEAHRFST